MNIKLQLLMDSFNQLDRENQVEAIRLLRNLNIRATSQDERYYIRLENKDTEKGRDKPNI